MTTNRQRAEAILTARHHKDQMEGDGAVGCFDAAAAAEELHAAGLLAPGPQIIHTLADLKALDPDTVVTDGILTATAGIATLYAQIGMLGIPAAVIATGDHTRAARRALEEA